MHTAIDIQAHRAQRKSPDLVLVLAVQLPLPPPIHQLPLQAVFLSRHRWCSRQKQLWGSRCWQQVLGRQPCKTMTEVQLLLHLRLQKQA